MKKYLLILSILPVLLSAQVSVRDTVIVWHTFKYELNDDNTMNWNSSSEYDTVSKVFNGYVVENEYLKVTLLPGFGGRILSLIYKPTGNEELYQNPAGSPYGVGQDWFYYSWLMVYGGIFPTLSEPEHGKAWFLPWDYSVVKSTPDSFQCKMSWKDTVDLENINYGKWQYGLTELRCEYTISLAKGSSALETEFTIYNDLPDDINYEYWTCLTLAPGSEPGNPQCNEEAEIIVPADQVKIPSWYPGIAGQEKRIPGKNGVYTFTKLRYWKNWVNDGIAYPWDDENLNYWGVINHQNEEGLIRVSDNHITTGIKIWAWGYEQSQNIDPFKDPLEVHRPYVEMWAGHSNEFFEPALIEGNSQKKWKEIYFPTVGLSNVTNASESAVAEFKIDEEKRAVLNFVTLRPETESIVTLEITGNNPSVLLSKKVVQDTKTGSRLSVDLPENAEFSSGDSLKFTVTDSLNSFVLTGSIPLDTLVTDVNREQSIASDFRLEQNYPNPFNPTTIINYSIPEGVKNSSNVQLKVFNLLGQEVAVLIDEKQNSGTHSVKFDASGLSSGIYIYRLVAGNYAASMKMVLLK